MGKHKKVNHIIDDVACEVGGTCVTKAAAKVLGISRKEANAIMFGVMQGMTIASTMHDEPSLVTEESAEMFVDRALIETLSEYADFKEADVRNRVLDLGDDA